MKTRFILLIALLFISSCTLDHETEGRIDSDTISIEEAMRSLDIFLSHQSQYSKETRSAAKKPHKIMTVTSSDIKSVTRSSSDETSTPLVYVVNYENDGGFAILAANTALPDPVIAVTEKGNLNNDLSLSRNGQSMQTEADEDFSCFIKTMIVNYIERERTSGRGEGDGGGEGGGTGGGDDTGDNPAGDDPNTNHPGGPANPLYNVAPLFPNWWDQDSPFNQYCPTIGGKHCKAGCTPVATAMALTYYYYSRNATWTIMNNHQLNLDSLYCFYLYDTTYTSIVLTSGIGEEDSALLLYHIGVSIGADYDTTATSAGLNSVKQYLQTSGFSNATLHNGYDLNYVIDMIPSGKIVIMSGYDAFFPSVGHSWIVDGIMQYHTSFSVQSLVHCNWGNYGIANGYYTSGVFTPNNGPVQIDPLDMAIDTGSHNYTYWIKTLTY